MNRWGAFLVLNCRKAERVSRKTKAVGQKTDQRVT